MIAVIDYGVGNLFSLCRSLEAIGQQPVVTGDPALLRQADKLVLPGVGAFADAAEKLRQTGETLDRQQFQTAVNAILRAKRVYIIGVRSAAPLANFLGYYLNYMFNNVHVISGVSAGEMFEKIVSVNSEDVVIAFSFPRYSSSTTKGAKYCRSAGATVIGITDSKLSPLGQCSDHVLVAKSDMVSLVDSIVAPLSLVNALIVAVASKREKELSQTFANLERIWDEYDVYEKQVER